MEVRQTWDAASDGLALEGGAIPSELLGAESRTTPCPHTLYVGNCSFIFPTPTSLGRNPRLIDGCMETLAVGCFFSFWMRRHRLRVSLKGRSTCLPRRRNPSGAGAPEGARSCPAMNSCALRRPTKAGKRIRMALMCFLVLSEVHIRLSLFPNKKDSLEGPEDHH